MPKSPKKNINPNKNKSCAPKDLSFNNPFLDPSDKIFNNPLFIPLQAWNAKKNTLLLEDRNKVIDNNINVSASNFNMKLNTILHNIREDRKQNSQNINSHNLIDISRTLSSSAINKNKIEPRFNTTFNEKDAMDDLISQITKKYDLITPSYKSTSSDTKLAISKKISNKDSLSNRMPSYLFNNKVLSANHFTPVSVPVPKTLLLAIPEMKKIIKTINIEINGLQDLLDLIDNNPLLPQYEYNINMAAMHDIKQPLHELNDMIGMHNLKNSIVDQIIYFVQNLHINKDALNPDFMHTCIYGPPGSGKTEIAKIMGKIFSSLGVLKKKTFRKVTRADLIAGYLGQTAIKTKDIIKQALDGVLFIDEAYALGNSEKRDSFAKECIDTLCESLSDHKGHLMVIIAGYEEDLNNCFFAYNQGLNSRFPWRFKTDDYKAEELNKIFQKKINDAGWSLIEKIPDSWFESKMDYFIFYGRDMETLLSKTKIAHGRRVFCMPKKDKTKLIMKDIENGFSMFIDNNNVKERNNKNNPINHMYI